MPVLGMETVIRIAIKPTMQATVSRATIKLRLSVNISARGSEANLRPRIGDRFDIRCLQSRQSLGNIDGHGGKLKKLRPLGHPRVAHSLVPDLADFLPGFATD